MNLDSILRSLKRSANRLHRFAWTAFQTRRGTTGAQNEKGKRRYGKEAERILKGGQADEEDTLIVGEAMDESEVPQRQAAPPKKKGEMEWYKKAIDEGQGKRKEAGKNAEISKRIKDLVESGTDVAEAVDKVLGEGAYQKTAGEVYDALKTPKVKPESKPATKPAGDVVGQLQSISDQFRTLSFDEIESQVRKLGNLDIAALKEAAKGFGLHCGLTSRKAILDKIVAKIHDRKEKSERGDRIATEAEISDRRHQR